MSTASSGGGPRTKITQPDSGGAAPERADNFAGFADRRRILLHDEVAGLGRSTVTDDTRGMANGIWTKPPIRDDQLGRSRMGTIWRKARRIKQFRRAG